MIDNRGRSPITAAEAAAFLGVSAGAVRQIVRRHHIPAVGQRGHAKVYWMHQIAQHAGAHDRLAHGDTGQVVSHLPRSDRIPSGRSLPSSSPAGPIVAMQPGTRGQADDSAAPRHAGPASRVTR